MSYKGSLGKQNSVFKRFDDHCAICCEPLDDGERSVHHIFTRPEVRELQERGIEVERNAPENKIPVFEGEDRGCHGGIHDAEHPIPPEDVLFAVEANSISFFHEHKLGPSANEDI